MPVSFNNIPQALRVPLFYAEMDASRAGSGVQQTKALLIGHTLKTDTNPVFLASEGAAADYTGAGSMLTDMYRAYRKNDTFMEIWGLPVAPPSGGTAAAGSVTVAGTALIGGTLRLYIGGKALSVGVSAGDTAAQVGDYLAGIINATEELSVSASADAGVVTLTAKWAGSSGNGISLAVNHKSGEATPTGLAVSITSFTGGAGVPDLAEALALVGDEEFDYIAMPFTDSASLTAIEEFMGDSAGRWSWSRQIYGHVFAAVKATLSEAQTLGASQNNQHLSILPVFGSITPVWEIAAILGAVAGKSLSADPARPLQTLPLMGFEAPKVQDRWTLQERNTLLYNGMATYAVNSGTGSASIERVVTTYRVNGYGIPDNAYLDVETLATAAYVLRAMRQRITSKFGRHKLADDGARFGAGQPIVTPKSIRAELIALYDELEAAGYVENAEIFAENLVVERNAGDVNRVDVVFPPDYVNQLRVFAVLNQFRLDY
jgi:phage tail sheath gpL-like